MGIMSNHNTIIRKNSVKYSSTEIVSWTDTEITLDANGYFSKTTKKKMNQAAEQFELGYKVVQKAEDWFVEINDETIPFNQDKITFRR